MQTVTVNGKTTDKRDSDFQYSIEIDVDLKAKTFTIEGGVSSSEITEVSGVGIAATSSDSIPGFTHANTWRLNRVTGELCGLRRQRQERATTFTTVITNASW